MERRVTLNVGVEQLDNGRILVTLEGDLDIATVDRFRSELLHVLASGDRPHVVVDLAGLDFMGVCGLDALVACQQFAVDRSGRLALTNAPPLVVRLIRIAGLESTLVAEGT